VARHEFETELARVERRYPDEGRLRRVVFPKDMSPECHRAILGDPKLRAASTELLRQIGKQNRHKARADEPFRGQLPGGPGSNGDE